MIDPRLKVYPAPVSTDGDISAGTSHWYMLQMVGAGKRVLEFGCASGYMSALMKAAGCHVTGIDVDIEAAHAAREICDEVIVADLDMRSLAEIVPDVAYDVVVFGDVLEHLRDPWRLLDDARRFVAPGGYAVISIPNIAHGSVRLKLLQGEFDYSELGILDDTHLRFFTLKSVEEMCLRAGFRIDAIERTKVALFQETPLTPNSKEMLFDPELLEQIRRDPEHDTLQFVLRATPLSDGEKFSALARELAAVRDRLRVAETSARLSQEAYDEVEAELEARERSGRPTTAGEVTRMPIAALEESDARRAPSGRPQRGKTISARAIKRAEAFAAANERLTAELAAERARVAELEASFAPGATLHPREELAQVLLENERLSTALRVANENFIDLKQVHSRCIESEAEHAKIREAMTLAVRRFLRYAETELASVQACVSEMDAAIAAVQNSKMWSLKRALGKLRR